MLIKQENTSAATNVYCMTRRLLLSSVVSLALPGLAAAKPPAKLKAAPAIPTPLRYALTDLGAADGIERVALSETGTVLITTEASSAAIPSHVLAHGKSIPLPENFVALSFGSGTGSLLGYTRTGDGKTHAAVYNAGGTRDLLAVTESENTRALLQSRTGIVVLSVATGDCALLRPGAKESEEIGRASIGDATNEAFRPVAVSADGAILIGNQGQRIFRYDAGDWADIVVNPGEEVDRTVAVATDARLRFVCGTVINSSAPFRQAFVCATTPGESPEETHWSPLPLLAGTLKSTYPNAAARAISPGGETVVGQVSTTETPEAGARAVLWQKGRAVDLTTRLLANAADYTVTEAHAINGAKQILAFAQGKAGRRLVLLSPR